MIIDIILIIFTIAGFWLGYSKGIAGTLVFALSYTAALLLTLKISPWLMDFLIRTVKTGKLFALIFGTLGVLILLIFLIHWVVKKADNYLKKSKLTRLSQILGGLVMVFVSILFYSLILWSVNSFGMVGSNAKSKSMTYSTLEVIPMKSRALIEKFIPLFSRYWELMNETVKETSSDTTE